MSDFIEREAAIKLFNFAVLDCLGMEPTIRAGDIIKALKSIPAADVREVVLCRDCKYWEYDAIFADGWCRGKHQGNPNWFCADGEKREEI